MEKIFGFERSSVLKVAGWLVLALVSFFVIANLPIIETMNASLVASLDEKKNTVTLLAVAATTSSLLVDALPNVDAVAENLADINDYLIIVFAALWLQKYLVGLAGMITFKLLVPLSSIMLAIGQVRPNVQLKQIASKMMVLGMVIFFLVPTSVGISKHIENTYDQSVLETSAVEVSEEAEKEEEQSWFDKVVNGVSDTVVNTVDSAKKALGNMIDAVAILIITTCVIPVLVFLFFIWVINLLFGLQLPTTIPKMNVTQQMQRRSRRSEEF